MNSILRDGAAIILAVAVILAFSETHAAGRGGEGPVFPARILLTDKTADLQTFHDLDLDIDGVYFNHARVYLTGEELDRLTGLGFQVTVLTDDGPAHAALARLQAEVPIAEGPDAPPLKYHTYDTLTADLQDIAANHPDIVRLISLGQSVQGRELWMVKITDNPNLEEDEPEAEYISSMHGDEVVGKELCFELIKTLTDGYGSDPRITALLDNTEIWIMPSMNPDGTELGQRYNAEFIDLNRNFPDQFDDPVNTPAGRAVETGRVMDWRKTVSVNLSANYHGGILVVNYPYDGNPAGASVYSPSPDDSLYLSLSRTYADPNGPLAASNSDSSFNNGVCNGADWYAINGGMQDWNYVWYGNFSVLVEVSGPKWPAASTLDTYWADNQESMLAYLERVHDGVRGLVTDAVTGLPVAATITVAGSDRITYTDPDAGDYHRLLPPGRYTLEFAADGYNTRVVDDVYAVLAPALRYDVTLDPLDTAVEEQSACVDPAAGCRSYLDIGETADMRLTVRNLGSSITGVAARLVPTGWYGSVARSEAAYPDLPPGGTGESSAPDHSVTLTTGVPAGHRIGFALEWSAAEGSGVTEPFYLDAGPATCTTVDGIGLPAAITDRNTTTSTVEFPADLEISEIRAAVDISHPWKGDLRVDLVAPSGARVALHNRSGGSQNDINGTFGVDLVPAEPFSRLLGEPSSGTWSLAVNDGSPGSSGTLNDWSLTICGRDLEAATPEMRLRGLSREGPAVRIEWWPYPGTDTYRVYRSTDPASAASFMDVTTEDPDAADTGFLDGSTDPVLFWLVTGVGPAGEGPKGHFAE